jgi:hypothetical protein
MRPARLLLAAVLALGAIALPSAAVVPPDWAPRAGEFVWKPEVAPRGPVVVVASLPLQQVHVYRNGVRIGASTISSGKRGHETPVGVFTILQKRAEHYSNLYDNAPMPWMQRLTWDGIALHAGRLPGHPASHGCIRLPEPFAKALFSTTRPGDVVIVTDRATAPGPAAGGDLMAAMGRTALPPARGDEWAPERAPSGPVSIVLGTRDARVLVMRDGVRIGSARVHVDPALRLGTRAWVLMDGAGDGMDPVLRDRPARRWLAIDVEGAADDGAVRAAIARGALGIPVALARRIDAILAPGATVVITDAPLGDGGHREPLELETDAAE